MKNKNKSEESVWRYPVKSLLLLMMTYGALMTTAKEPNDLFRIIGPAIIISVIISILTEIHDKLK